MWARRQFLLARELKNLDSGSGGLPRFPARASLNRDFLIRVDARMPGAERETAFRYIVAETWPVRLRAFLALAAQSFSARHPATRPRWIPAER